MGLAGENNSLLRRSLVMVETHYFFKELMVLFSHVIFSHIYFSKVISALFFKLIGEECICL